jgi:hypothetical protein
MRSFLLSVLLVVISAGATAHAADRKPLSIAAITEQQVQIREGVIAGTGRYKDMPSSKRVDLLSKQAGLMEMLAGKTSTDDLTEPQRVEAFNTLEWIEAAINGVDDERMVCHREKVLGSTRMTRVCRTVAEDRRLREEARDRMETHDPFGQR